MKITKAKLKQIIKEELKGSLKEDNGEGMSPEHEALVREGGAFFGKIIAIAKTEQGKAGDILDALADHVKDSSSGNIDIGNAYYYPLSDDEIATMSNW